MNSRFFIIFLPPCPFISNSLGTHTPYEKAHPFLSDAPCVLGVCSACVFSMFSVCGCNLYIYREESHTVGAERVAVSVPRTPSRTRLNLLFFSFRQVLVSWWGSCARVNYSVNSSFRNSCRGSCRSCAGLGSSAPRLISGQVLFFLKPPNPRAASRKVKRVHMPQCNHLTTSILCLVISTPCQM